MNGKRAKQIRRLSGISTHAKREQRAFERDVLRAIEQRAVSRVNAYRARRVFFAWAGLAALAAAIVALWGAR